MSVALLDVNVLIALAWPSHVHHREVSDWFHANRSAGWATCPLTQCGFIRLSSNPRFIDGAVTPIEAVALLKGLIGLKRHSFWPDDLSYHDEETPAGLLIGHRQITDAYLLGLSIKHKGRLATLDKGIAALLPPDSPFSKALEILPAGGKKP